MGSLIRLVAIVCSGLVLLGFAYFATDELSRGSKHQQNALKSELGKDQDRTPIAPSPTQEAQRERVNGKFREGVEDANDILIGPFANLVDSSTNSWVTHGVPALLGLLLYGFCLGMLANMLPKSRDHGADWRTVESA
jgi:hypothetical protein